MLVLIVLFVNYRLRDSRLGRAWIALREDEVAIGEVLDQLALRHLGIQFGGGDREFLTTVVLSRVVAPRLDSVRALAAAAEAAGPVHEVIHTAGLSPVQAPPAAILAVDLLGVALVLDAFADVCDLGEALVAADEDRLI